MFQPKTGQGCYCRKGKERDNCPECEGTGMRINFKAIRDAKLTTAQKYSGMSEEAFDEAARQEGK